MSLITTSLTDSLAAKESHAISKMETQTFLHQTPWTDTSDSSSPHVLDFL